MYNCFCETSKDLEKENKNLLEMNYTFLYFNEIINKSIS